MSAYTRDEMMAVEASLRLDDGSVCFVGIGLPSLASNLARRAHAPGCVLLYESGTIGAKPHELPLSIGDGELAETADAVVTDLGVLEPREGELSLTRVHPGVDAERVREATGWELRVAPELGETEPPSNEELEALRSLRTKGDA